MVVLCPFCFAYASSVRSAELPPAGFLLLGGGDRVDLGISDAPPLAPSPAVPHPIEPQSEVRLPLFVYLWRPVSFEPWYPVYHSRYPVWYPQYPVWRPVSFEPRCSVLQFKKIGGQVRLLWWGFCWQLWFTGHRRW